jgi:hypothetical protein
VEISSVHSFKISRWPWIALQAGDGQSYNVGMATPTDTLVTLAELSTDMEASMIIAALEREEIEAFMKGEFTAGWRAKAPSWPKVEVRESDYARARAILDSLEASRHAVTEEDTDDEVDRTWSINWRKFCRFLVTAYLITVGLFFAAQLITVGLHFANDLMKVFGWQ